MRKVTREIAEAFYHGKSKSVGNTSCNADRVLLHGNEIARRIGTRLELTMCGWGTPTTRERLNGICDMFGFGRPFSQSKCFQYYNNTKIADTDRILIDTTDGKFTILSSY